ncbi:hypothetical protein [Acuticoccus mangrovi]|uniref:Uncharacterized protein n=1 Tax=Acuticoccus mangrovi TaxID=2796142 RepID=A0A934IKM2_9HYPH|nr:hypothetical protein [Acuticoccus mangrovi]MBJ3774365.1 hypothetical protein [Acuticoccus mangrovi]
MSEVKEFLTDAAAMGASSATVGSVTADGDTVTVTNYRVEWSADLDAGSDDVTFRATIDVPTISLEGFARADGRYSSSRLTIPSMEASAELSGGAKETVSVDAKFTDYTATNPSWAPLPTIADDPQAPVSRFAPLAEWALTQSFDGTSLASSTVTVVAPDQTQTTETGPITSGPQKDGLLSSMEYGPTTTRGTTIMPKDPGADDASGAPEAMQMEFVQNAQKVRITNFDVRPLVALLTGKGADGSVGTLLESAVSEGFSMSFGDLVNVKIGPNRLENVTLDPSAGPVLQKLDTFVVPALQGEEPDPQTFLPFALDLYGAFGIGTFSVSDVKVSGPEGGDAAAGVPPFSVGLSQLIVEGLSSAGLDRFLIGGLEADVPGGSGKLGSFELGSLVFPARDVFMEAVMANMIGVQPDLQTTLGAIPYLGKVSVAGLEVNQDDGETFKVDLFETLLKDYIAPIPTEIAITLKGLELPVSMLGNPQTAMVLTALKADPVKADAEITLRWDEDTQRVELDENASVGGVGTLQADATLSGIPRLVFENPMRANEAIATAAVNGISLKFSDDGITSFLLGMISQQAGLETAQFVEMLSQQAAAQVNGVTGDQSFAQQVSDTLRAYLSDPKSLSISASPTNPVAVAQILGAAMTAPQALPGLINFSMSAND